MAGVKPHQPRYPSRPSALVRSNAHDYQRGTPVRCYDARDCPEATLELRIPSHTALSGSRPAEVLLAVPRAHSSLTPSRSASSGASACGRAMCHDGARVRISARSGAARGVSFGSERGDHGLVRRWREHRIGGDAVSALKGAKGECQSRGKTSAVGGPLESCSQALMSVSAKREDAPHQEEMRWAFREHRTFICHAPASIVVAGGVRCARLTLEARLCQKWHSKRRLLRQRASHLFFGWYSPALASIVVEFERVFERGEKSGPAQAIPAIRGGTRGHCETPRPLDPLRA